jgi:hypothetical protein
MNVFLAEFQVKSKLPVFNVSSSVSYTWRLSRARMFRRARGAEAIPGPPEHPHHREPRSRDVGAAP